MPALIIEWSAAIVNGVKTYMNVDADVALFAKFLKNEFEEDYRATHEKIKESLNGIIKVCIRERHPRMPEIKVSDTLENIQKGVLDRNLRTQILEHIYNTPDVDAI